MPNDAILNVLPGFMYAVGEIDLRNCPKRHECNQLMKAIGRVYEQSKFDERLED